MKEKILSIQSPVGVPIELYKFSWGKANPGSGTYSIVSGLHGNQLNGIYVNTRLIRFLNDIEQGREPSFEINGRVQIFPAVNVNALASGDRLWNYDEMDMDLAFPGNKLGEVGERIAEAILRHTQETQYGVLLTNGREFYEDVPHIQCHRPDGPIKKLARSLAVEFARDMDESPASRLKLCSQWLDKEIPALILSAGKPGNIDLALCDLVFNSVMGSLVTNGILSGKNYSAKKTKVRFYGPRDELRVRAKCSGLFIPQVKAGTALSMGQKIGETQDIYSGGILEEFLSPGNGYLVTLRSYPVIYAREPVAVILNSDHRGIWSRIQERLRLFCIY